MFFLERVPQPQGSFERVRLSPLPFRIGRASDNDHQIDLAAVSKAHAVFDQVGDTCSVRDLGSTNGTFVNGDRVSERLLSAGDVVQLGPVEFTFGVYQGEPARSVFATQALPVGAVLGTYQTTTALRQLIDRAAVEIVFQPILNLQTRQVVSYEALGRGAHPAVPRAPVALFSLAATCGLAVELSQCLRRVALASARCFPRRLPLFLNVHPDEVRHPSFLPSIEALQAANDARRPLVVEIAESSVVSTSEMRALVHGLASNVVRFAYDDFGAGQARLLELADVPPHFLKFDRSLIHGSANTVARRDVIAALARVARSLHVQVVAEGIEVEAEAAVCAEAGCDLGQGFLWGIPDEAPRSLDTTPLSSGTLRHGSDTAVHPSSVHLGRRRPPKDEVSM